MMLRNCTLLLVLVILFSGITIPVNSHTSTNEVFLDQTDIGAVLSLNATGLDIGQRDISGRYDLVQFGDGLVSSIWDTIPTYPLSSFGETTGSVSSFYGEEMVYFLFKQDPFENWISIQWDTDNTADPEVDPNIDEMEEGDDLWVFGQTEDTLILGDAHLISFPDIEQDESEHLFWERVLVNNTDGELEYIAWEVKRMRNTEDTQGQDVVFTPDVNVTARFASSNNHKSPASNNFAKFVLSSTGLGGNVTIDPPQPAGGDGNEGFIGQQFLIGGLIGLLSYIIIIIPTVFIIRKQEAAQ